MLSFSPNCAWAAIPNGDINGDGVVNAADVVLAQRIAMGIVTATPDQLSRGDVAPINAPDGVINAADVVVIQRIAMGLLNTYTITAAAGGNGTISSSGTVSVISGATATFMMTPDTGYQVLDVLVDGASVGAVSTYTFSDVTTNHTIAASFAINTYTITATAGANGTISPAGVVSVNSGATTTFTVTPNTGYHVSDVLVDGVSKGAITSYPFTNVTANHTITASFAINTYTITASTGANGTISPSGIVSVHSGATTTFTITPTTGYHVADVLVDGATVGAVTAYTFTNVTANHTIAASFAAYTTNLPKIGIYANQTWYLDLNGNGAWDSTPIDAQYSFGGGIANAIPVTGDWTGTGTTKIGTYADGTWYLDLNGNGVWDGTPTDAQYSFGNGVANAIPVTGDWTGTGTTKVGIYANGEWDLDLNGNGVWDGTPTDAAYSFGGGANAIPVIGDWTGTGTMKIGIYANGEWDLDLNGNGVWDGAPIDAQYSFGGGIANAIPVTGDWTGTGTTKIGTYADGTWYVDLNGNGVWDGAPTDAQYSFGNGMTGAVPVTGKWGSFAINTYTITASAGANGTISPSGIVSVNSGATATFVITPNAGYHVSNVLIDAVSAGTITSYTFNNVSTDHTISSVFSVNSTTTIVSGSVISSNTTWTLAGSPYIVTGDVFVYGAGSPTLTIEPGVTIKFNQNKMLKIGNGTTPGALNAVGTSTAPIIFTSNQESPTPGYWTGIYFDDGTVDANTILSYVTVEYGGYERWFNLKFNLYINSASPTITNSTIRQSPMYGIYLYSGSPSITGNTISDNGTYGLYDSIGAATVSGNTFSGNGSYPVRMGIYQTGNTNTYGTNGINAVEIVGGQVSQNLTMKNNGIPYVIMASTSVGSSSSPVLTIDPGVTLKFYNNRWLWIGSGTTNPGALKAVGTASSPIIFTSNDPSPGPGKWSGILFGSGTVAANSILDHVTVEYGGATYSSNLNIISASPTIQNCTIQQSSVYGIKLDSSNSIIQNTVITNNATHGIYNSSAGSPSITGNTISNNGSYGLYDPIGTATVSGNTFSGNASYPVRMGINQTGNTNTYGTNGINAVEIVGGQVTQNLSMKNSGIPYIITSDINVYSTSGPVFTIEPGVTAKFNQNTMLKIGSGTTPGALNAIGTSTAPILLTSSQTSPTPGYWTGIYFDDGTVDANTTLSYVTVEYGGYERWFNLKFNLYIDSASPKIQHCTIRQSPGYGIYVSGSGANPAISYTVIDGNVYGLYATTLAMPTISNSDIINSTSYGVYNDSTFLRLDATKNWWGDSSGPYHSTNPSGSGNQVSDYVDFSPWLGTNLQNRINISNVAVSSNVLDVSASNAVTIFYTIDAPATMRLKIIPEKQGPSGSPIYQATQTCSAAGGYLFTWDGHDSTGNVVPDEAYLYLLEAVVDGVTAGIYSPAASKGSATPVVSLSGDIDPSRNIPVTINYSVSIAARCTLMVAVPYRLWITNPPIVPAWAYWISLEKAPLASGINYSLDWDGKNRDGKIVASPGLLIPGTSERFDLILDCQPMLLAENHIIVKSIINVGDAPKITQVKADPYELQLSYGEFVRIKYNLSRNASVTITLVSPSGTAINIANGQAQSAGDQEFEWRGIDSTDASGKKLVLSEEGIYTVRITAVNPESGSISTAYGKLKIGL